MTIDTLRLIGPRVLVLRDPPETETAGGLAIPGVAQTPANKTLNGLVVKVGSKRTKSGAVLPLACAPGDRVTYGFLDGEDLRIEDREYVLLQESEVKAVLGG